MITPTPSIDSKKEMIRRSMDEAVAKFLAEGGQITQCKTGESGNVEGVSMWGRPGRKKKSQEQESDE